ncbi:DUF6193 family natural product biosynthesis protein [Kitasatospora sp. NPDC059646]|uniref:DUF6193 family natural product biosynthesis protein n=1 Tax=Kitasatospora sp. NPDC059646 TaxID=3346893 RepID=UPI0036BA2790
MTDERTDPAAAEREAAAAFGAELARSAAGLGLPLPAPEQLGRFSALFRDAGTADAAWIRTLVPDAGPALSLHRGDVALVHGHAPDLTAAVRAVATWLAGADLAALRAAAPFLTVHDWAFAHERAPLDEVELAWRQQLGHLELHEPHPYPPGYRAMFRAAFAEPRLRRLTPVTSHHTLWFSTVPRFPFHRVGPAVCPLNDGAFLVRQRDGEPVEVATAEQAVALAVAGLPPGC